MSKSMVRREWSTFQQSTASVVERKIEFNGISYSPDRAKAYVEAIMCHSLPKVNSARRGWTAATLANSLPSVRNQMVDFEHRLKFYAQLRGETADQVCGTIVDAEFPEKKVAMDLAASGRPVAFRVLLALYRKAEGVETALADIASGADEWLLSQESEYNLFESALWDGKNFYPWSECSAEMQALVQPTSVEVWQDKELSLICGGQDGHVLLSGCALTRTPRDRGAAITQVAASEKTQTINLNVGWKSDADKAAAQPTVFPTTCKVVAPAPVMSRTSLGDEASQEVASMKTLKELVAWIRTRATELKDADANTAKKMEEISAMLDQAVAAEDVESVVAARIKSGDLVPKATHDKMVVDAKAAGRDELAADIAAKEAAAKAAAEAKASRLAEVSAAKLDPKFVLGVDRTIESVISAIPATEEGHKMFAERLEEWKAFAKATGQAVASAVASEEPKKTIVPLGGGAVPTPPEPEKKISALGAMTF